MGVRRCRLKAWPCGQQPTGGSGSDRPKSYLSNKTVLEGILARNERQEVLKLHRNAQRLLKPVFVANPFARDLTFLDSQTRTRRDHLKYLTLIRSIALLHQCQRPVKTTTHHGKQIEYIEVTLEDIETANRLAHEVLGRSLDELPPQTRRLLLQNRRDGYEGMRTAPDGTDGLSFQPPGYPKLYGLGQYPTENPSCTGLKIWNTCSFTMAAGDRALSTN